MPSRPSHSKEWNSPSAMRLASVEEFTGDTRKVPGGRAGAEGGEGRRNVEVMWLLGRLAPDHKTIATFARARNFGSARDARKAPASPPSL
jgi:hypothetical protein